MVGNFQGGPVRNRDDETENSKRQSPKCPHRTSSETVSLVNRQFARVSPTSELREQTRDGECNLVWIMIELIRGATTFLTHLIAICLIQKSVLFHQTMTHRPANVPQRHANQAMHARYAQHARIFFLSGFVSVENKERCIYLPKLDVAGSIPVARSNSSVILKLNFQEL